MPCHHCGKEGYDRVRLVNGHGIHPDCGGDVCVPEHPASIVLLDRLWHDHCQYEHFSTRRCRADCYLCVGFHQLRGMVFAGEAKKTMDEAFG